MDKVFRVAATTGVAALGTAITLALRGGDDVTLESCGGTALWRAVLATANADGYLRDERPLLRDGDGLALVPERQQVPSERGGRTVVRLRVVILRRRAA